MVDGQTFLTVEGLEKLKRELYELKQVRRLEIAEKIERAKELGDLSENAEYQEAKDEQAFVEGRIIELEDTLNTATVVEARGGSSHIEIGSSVVLKVNGDERSFTIVGANEADPTNGKISNESPLGRALIGRSVRDEVKVETPRGPKMYKVLSIA